MTHTVTHSNLPSKAKIEINEHPVEKIRFCLTDQTLFKPFFKFYLNISQLRPQLKPAQNKINNNFGTTEHRRKVQKAKLVRIKSPIELFNFYLMKTFLY